MLALGNDLLLRWNELQPTVRQQLARDLLRRIATTTEATPEPATIDRLADLALQQHLRAALSGNLE